MKDFLFNKFFLEKKSLLDKLNKPEFKNLIVSDFLSLLKCDYLNFIEPINYVELLSYSIVLFNHSFALFKEKYQNIYNFTDNQFISNFTENNLTKTKLIKSNYFYRSKDEIDLESLGNNRFLYIFTDNESDFLELDNFINYFFGKEEKFFLLKGEKYQKRIKDIFGISSRMEVFSTVPPDFIELPFICDPNLSIDKLTMKDFDFVRNNYDSDDSYIESRINDLMFGAFYKDILVGFIGIHEDGSMGLLFVCEEYRNRGIGSLLEKKLINYLRDKNLPCFGQIDVKNDLSITVHKKSSYRLSSETIYWCY